MSLVVMRGGDIEKAERRKHIRRGSFIMRPLRHVILAIVVAAFVHYPLGAFAEMRELQIIQLEPHMARFTLFDRTEYLYKKTMAISASGDLIVFVTSPNGKWELSRVRHWANAKPEIAHISLPGYFTRKEQSALRNIDIKVLLTPDGRFAVCIGSAERQPNKKEMPKNKINSVNVISVVDLHNFTVGQSRRTSDLGLLELQSVGMTSAGRLFVDSVARPSKEERELISLDIPSLKAGAKCKYRWSNPRVNDSTGLMSNAVESCAQDFILSFFADAIKSVPSSAFTCGKMPAELCPQPNNVTSDLRYGIGIRPVGHFSIFGDWVWSGPSIVVFSTQTRSEIGEIDLMDYPTEYLLAAYSGKEYLLVLRPGSKLAVYELLENSDQP